MRGTLMKQGNFTEKPNPLAAKSGSGETGVPAEYKHIGPKTVAAVAVALRIHFDASGLSKFSEEAAGV